jgi:hypothetical protein
LGAVEARLIERERSADDKIGKPRRLERRGFLFAERFPSSCRKEGKFGASRRIDKKQKKERRNVP